MLEREAWEDLQRRVEVHLAGRGGGRCLEAGCGSWSFVKFPPGTHLVGLDISEQQLARNSIVHERIVGDLQATSLPPTFDLVACVDVVEHLERPDLALSNLIDALAPGGLLVLKAPNPKSFKGFITRHTPLWFHVFVYRFVFGDRRAGREGRAPFHTPMKREMWLDRVLARSDATKLEVVCAYSWDVGDGRWFRRMPWVRRPYNLVRRVANAVLPGRWQDSEYMVVFRRMA